MYDEPLLDLVNLPEDRYHTRGASVEHSDLVVTQYAQDVSRHLAKVNDQLVDQVCSEEELTFRCESALDRAKGNKEEVLPECTENVVRVLLALLDCVHVTMLAMVDFLRTAFAAEGGIVQLHLLVVRVWRGKEDGHLAARVDCQHNVLVTDETSRYQDLVRDV